MKMKITKLDENIIKSQSPLLISPVHLYNVNKQNV